MNLKTPSKMAYHSKEEYRGSGDEQTYTDVTRVHDSNTKLWVEPLGSILDKEYPKPEPLIKVYCIVAHRPLFMVEQGQVNLTLRKKFVLVWLARLTSVITKLLRQSRFFMLMGRCSQQTYKHVISK